MEPINIAVIATEYGFKLFKRDLVLPSANEVLYPIKFIQIDDDVHKIRSHHFHSFIIHHSGMNFEYLHVIINSIQQRMIKIKGDGKD